MLVVTCMVFGIGACLPKPETEPTITPSPTPTATPIPEGVHEVTFEFSVVRTHSPDMRELAVAFNTLQFLDYDEHISGELTFGVGDDSILLGEGWWDDEVWDGTFPFQWAGTQAMQASIQITIPENTEALLLRVNGTEDSVWMNVKLDGETVANLRVDAYWHLAYVPIGPPPDPIPISGEIEWNTGRYFPDFPNSDHIYAFPVRHPLQDHSVSWVEGWRINQSYDAMMALTLVGMQGVINRGGARVYLDWQDHWQRSSFWIPYIQSQVPVTFYDFDALSTVDFLVRRFGNRFVGAVRYDPEIPDTINLATTLAGFEDRLMLAPEQEAMPGFPTFASTKDVCTEVGIQYCDPGRLEENKIELYRWVYEELWAQLDHRIIGLISPGPPTSVEIPGTQNYMPLGLSSRDYVIALKLPVLWLAPPDVENFPPHCPPYEVQIPPGSEAELFGLFLEDAKEEAEGPIAVYGFYGVSEAGTVAMASLFGDSVPVLTNSNSPISASNLTVYTSLEIDPEPLGDFIDYDQIYATLDASHVFTLVSSDGDNIQFLLDRGFHGVVDFVWDKIQGNRFGWTFNPTLREIAPLVWNYYVSERDEVSLVAGLSGAGYTYPQLMDDDELAGYLAYANRYLSEAGIETLNVTMRYGFWDQVAEAYYAALPNPGFLGTFTDLSVWPWSPGFYYAGVPVPAVDPAYIVTPDNRSAILDDLLSRVAGEVFIDLAGDHDWYWDDPEKDSYLWHTGEDVCLNTNCSEQALLFSNSNEPRIPAVWGPFATLMPGEYTASYRMKVAENNTDENVVNIYVMHRHGHGCEETQLAHRTIKANQFNQADMFQEFTVEFAVDDPMTGIEFRIDHLGVSDLYMDSIHVVREDILDLPVIASGFIVITRPEEMTEVPQMAGEMQAAGILVLSPDEFMAAINPEFMTNWAADVMSPSHPDVREATHYLNSGDFFASLLAARKALGPQPRRAFDLELSTSCVVTINTNTWITNLAFSTYGRQLTFDTHSYPHGSVQTQILIPDACIPDPYPDTRLEVLVDGVSVPFDLQHEAVGLGKSTQWKITFQFPQGEHQVVVKEH